MGLIAFRDTLKLALARFRAHTAHMGITQWFDFEASRPGGAVACPERRSVHRSRQASFGGIRPRHTSSPKDPMYFADFRARLIEPHAPARQRKAVA